jgi:predicted Zn-dependent protease
VQADLQKKAATDPNSGIKLGLIYWTYGKNNEAEAAIRKAMSGKLSDPDWAKVALGHVLFSEGKKADAVAAFNSVAKNSKEASIARLWSIYARKG